MVKLISITPDAEKLMSYCARVSSPHNQDNPDYEKLLAYCAKNGHWSVFEMADMCVEIKTSRAIAAQILRHKSFSFQEFSQRYAQSTSFVQTKARRQDQKNRQNSTDDLSANTQEWFKQAQAEIERLSMRHYEKALELDIAKECARFLLPLNTETTMYMKGSARSFIHYLNVRCDMATQLEHREIAEQIKKIFITELPTVAKALEWK